MNDMVKQELEIIRNENGGFLHPAKVVEYARDENTALHECFEWDDTEAAEKYRLAQARAVIRVCVVVEENTSQPVRTYVSLRTDRKEGGYRAMVDVVNDEVLKERLLADALKELAYFKRKYETLTTVAELGAVFKVIDEVVRTPSKNEERLAV